MAIYQDGSFPSGSPILVTSLDQYVCNSFSVEKSAETTAIINENGAVAGHLQWQGDITGTAEVQFSSANTNEPTVASENGQKGVFLNVNIAGANRNCFITAVTIQKPQRGQWTASVQWTARVNP